MKTSQRLIRNQIYFAIKNRVDYECNFYMPQVLDNPQLHGNFQGLHPWMRRHLWAVINWLDFIDDMENKDKAAITHALRMTRNVSYGSLSTKKRGRR